MPPKPPDQLRWFNTNARILFLCGREDGAVPLDVQRIKYILGMGKGFIKCLNGIILISSSQDSLVVHPQPGASDGMSAEESGGDEEDDGQADNNDDDDDDDEEELIELSCGNAAVFTALITHQFQNLRQKCDEPGDIPAFNSNWAKDHIFIHSREATPSAEASSEAALSTLAKELINRKITHVIPTTIATARFFLQNPGIFDQLSNCGSIYPSRYIVALASQTKVLCRALDTIWKSMSIPNDPLVPNLSHVVHQTKRKDANYQTKGNKRMRTAQTLDSWNTLILQNDGGADWIEENMVIYALTLEGQVCPVSLYKLKGVGSKCKLQLTNTEETNAGNVFSQVTKRNGGFTKVNPHMKLSRTARGLCSISPTGILPRDHVYRRLLSCPQALCQHPSVTRH